MKVCNLNNCEKKQHIALDFTCKRAFKPVDGSILPYWTFISSVFYSGKPKSVSNLLQRFAGLLPVYCQSPQSSAL
jgi:hypothetical protein